MTNRIHAASYERGLRLIAAGCPLDYPDALPGHSAARRKPFRAEQLAGYAESRVYLLGPMQTGYLIALRLGSDRPSGTVITEWRFEPPWENHPISWEYEAADLIPEEHREAYAHLLDSRLMGVLNDGCLLRRGHPVEGLLCGCSYQPIPECGDRSVFAKLTLVDDAGNTAALRIALAVVRRAAIRSDTYPTRAGPRFQRG
jgi:hypothetical protein